MLSSAARTSGAWRGAAEGLKALNDALDGILKATTAHQFAAAKERYDREQDRIKQAERDEVIKAYTDEGYTRAGAIALAENQPTRLVGKDLELYTRSKAQAEAAGQEVVAQTATKDYLRDNPAVSALNLGEDANRRLSQEPQDLKQRRLDELASVEKAGPSSLTMETPAMRTPTVAAPSSGRLSASDILSGRGGGLGGGRFAQPRLAEPRMNFAPESGGVVDAPYVSVPARMARERQQERVMKQSTESQQLTNARLTGNKTQRDMELAEKDEERKQWEHDQAVGKAARELKAIPEFKTVLLPLIADGKFEEAADTATALLNATYAADPRGDILRASINEWRTRAATETQEFEKALSVLSPEEQARAKAARATGTDIPTQLFETKPAKDERNAFERIVDDLYSPEVAKAKKKQWVDKELSSGQGREGNAAIEYAQWKQQTYGALMNEYESLPEGSPQKNRLRGAIAMLSTEIGRTERFDVTTGFRSASEQRAAQEAMGETAKSYRTDLYRQFKQDATLAPFVITDNFGNPIGLRQGADTGKVLAKLRSVAAGYDKQIPRGVVAEIAEVIGRDEAWLRDSLTGQGIELYDVPTYVPPPQGGQKAGTREPLPNGAKTFDNALADLETPEDVKTLTAWVLDHVSVSNQQTLLTRIRARATTLSK